MKKAFTLIELLVVVAIIGILATVVIVNVSSAQDKAKDAKVKADLNTVQTAASLYFNDNNSYAALNCNPIGGVLSTCDSLPGSSTDPNIQSIVKAATDIKSTLGIGNGLTIDSDTFGAFQASADLPSTAGSSNAKRAIVDSSNSVTTIATLLSPSLNNGGFENGMTGWDYEIRAGGASQTLISSPTNLIHSGSTSRKLTSGSPISSVYTGLLKDNILDTTSTYRISFYAETDAGSPVVTSAYRTNWYSGNPTTLSTSWKFISYNFTASTNDNNTLGIYNYTTANSNIYIDDITLGLVQ